MTELESTPAWTEIAALVPTTPLATLARRFAHVPGLTPGAIAAAWTRTHPHGAAFDLDDELPPEAGDAQAAPAPARAPAVAGEGVAWRVVWREADGDTRSGIVIATSLERLVARAEALGEILLLERVDGRVLDAG